MLVWSVGDMLCHRAVVFTCFWMASLGFVIPTVRLNDGNAMPRLALGSYLGIDQGTPGNSTRHVMRTTVARALDLGYRHIDTAAIYDTETAIGEACNLKLKEGKVKREDLFITTKLWNTHHRREQVPLALRESLQRLGLDYVDLYLMHWPMGLNEDNSYSSTDLMETYRGLEDVSRAGLARSIGVSNFNVRQMDRLWSEAELKPAVLQIEVHPQMIQSELVALCRRLNITVMGYSPLGTLVQRFGAALPGPKLDNPALVDIATNHGKTSAQVVLRWQVDRNIVPIVKSTNSRRLEENINIFDFKLTNEEVARVAAVANSTFRLIEPSFWQGHRDYPFEQVLNPVANPFTKQ